MCMGAVNNSTYSEAFFFFFIVMGLLLLIITVVVTTNYTGECYPKLAILND